MANRTGLSRPGAMQMVISGILWLVLTVAPFVMAARSPYHEIFLAGLPAAMIWLAYIAVFISYLIGFFRYAGSKGYGALVSILLLVCHLLGFIILLLLPDRKAQPNAPSAG